ncbi:MAG: VOC family protein [Alphaproteobacteria bacterium]|jgi:hypothetical protein|nr:VOC family protein [Alphaproteobacteria bacterium]MDP6566930.1 VOC family protein [Alphaproteobacteria bacterium]MDP6815869.1 VOC family protein [Alphaproteobacteria bacterium]
MSRLFGAVRQNGYVVPDIEAAMRHWVEVLGVGPWFAIGELPLREAIYRGRPTDARASIALANSGDLQIELIEPLNDAPSPYGDFLADCPTGGLHHLSSWPDGAAYDAALERFTAGGGEVVLSGRVGGTRLAYLDTQAHLGSMFEMAALDDLSIRLFTAIRAAADCWDGGEPIRRSWPELD